EAEAQQAVAEALKVVGSALLGLTVGCAQCHDHRYDPIPQSDYYRLRAVFEPAFDPARFRRPAQRLVSLYTAADRAPAAAGEAEADTRRAERAPRQRRSARAAFERERAKSPAGERDAPRAAFDPPAGRRSEGQKKLVAAHPNLNITPGVLYQYDQRA